VAPSYLQGKYAISTAHMMHVNESEQTLSRQCLVQSTTLSQQGQLHAEQQRQQQQQT
jgi:hypothetical protein